MVGFDRVSKMQMATVFVVVAIVFCTNGASGQSTSAEIGQLHVRLKDGETTSTYQSGRLEISRDTVTWESVCESYFDKNQAVAVCSTLGFSRGEVIANLTYGKGSVNVSAAAFSCGVGSKSLSACYEYIRESDCNSTRAVGVFCFNNTKDAFQLRLADGLSAGNIRVGRLEVRMGQLPWGSVCYDRFASREGETACKEMGFMHGEVHYTPVKDATRFWLTELYCRTVSDSLLDCFSGKFGQHDCLLDEYVSLRCYNSSVRLKNAEQDVLNAGSVELYTELGWVEVCHDNWNDKNAKVVCRELGFVDGKALCCNQLGETRWGSLSVRSMVQNVSCTENETSLIQCPMHKGADRASCPFDSDSVIELGSVICYDQPYSSVDTTIKVRLANNGVPSTDAWGTLEVQHEGLWGEICADISFGDKEAQVACAMLGYSGGRALGQMEEQQKKRSGTGRPVWLDNVVCSGNETSLDVCRFKRWGFPTGDCYENPMVICYRRELTVRLGGRKTDKQTFGRVDIAYDGVVGTVCAEGWTDDAAKLACKTMGYSGGKMLATAEVPQGSGPMYLSDVICEAGDETIFQCANSGWKQPSSLCSAYSKQAGMACFEKVRLHPGTHSVGVVTVYSPSSGDWEPVCGKTFDNSAAKVVCRQLGFQDGIALAEGVFGYQLGPYAYSGLSCKGDEATLDDCPVNSTITTCIPFSFAYASVSCFDQLQTVTSPYMLSGSGTGEQAAGIVQIFKNGTWGYACDEFWTANDSSVLCKQLGYIGGVPMRHHGEVDGPFFIMHAGCRGNETHLEQCRRNMEPCDYSEPAGVLCHRSDSGAPKLSLSPVGSLPNNGHLVLTVDGVEGRVCADGWGDTDAEVACRQLGFRTGFARRSAITNGPVYVSNVDCYGYEDNLLRCQNKGWRQFNDTACNGPAAADAGVMCFNNVKLVNGDIGASYISGDLQVYLDSWRKTCSAGFDRNDSTVVCRELGFNNSAILASARYDYGTTYLTNLGCYGNEMSVANCSSNLARCSSRDGGVRVICFNGDISSDWRWDISFDYHGQVRLWHLGTNGVVCEEGWSDMAADTLCRQKGFKGGKALGTVELNHQQEVVWLTNISCPATAKNMSDCSYSTNVSKECRESLGAAGVLCYKVSEPQLRLANGGRSYGRVEINYDGTWGTICDASWTKYDASTVCRQLGFIDGVAYSNSYYGPGTGPVYLNSMRCRVEDTSLLACPSTGWGDYTDECPNHREDASVQCFEKLRLEPKDNIGAVVMFTTYNYALICDDGGFNNLAAKVVCREMGYDYGKYLCCSPFGVLPNRVVGIGEVRCTGREEKFENCSMRQPITEESCPLMNYAAVACSNSADSGAYKVTLSEGYFGKLQLEHFGEKGLVCPNGFDDKDAHVACKEAGHVSGFAYQYPRYRYGVQRDLRWLTNLTCNGNEVRLDSCGHSAWGQIPGCSLESDAAAFCAQTEAQAGLQWRLAGGDGSSGRVEVKLNGTWGTICGLSESSDVEANLICRHLGYHSGRVKSFNSIGGGSGPVWLSGLKCPPGAQSIFDCPMEHPGQAVESCLTHNYDLAVDCFSEVQLVRKGQKFTDWGRVEVFSQDRNTWLAVCDDSFRDHAANLVCQTLGKQYGRRQCCSAMGHVYVPAYANITCADQATTFASCAMNKSAGLTCRSKNYATVFCSNVDSAEDFKVELSNTAGMPLVSRYGIKGTICSDDFTDLEAVVLCRGLSFRTGYAIQGPQMTEGTEHPMVLSGVRCRAGSEANLSDCTRDDFKDAVHNCASTRPTVNVLCSRNDEIKYRLNPVASDFGRAEIYLNGHWGLISRLGFAEKEASVFCRGAGYDSGVPEYTRGQGLSQAPIILSSVMCHGNETSIIKCFGDWTAANELILPSFGVYVRCNRGVKLSRSTIPGTGMVVAHHNTTGWGPVCANMFDDRDAMVVCRELGYLNGKSLCCAAFGYNFEELVITDLQCTGSESSIFKCPLHDNTMVLRTCDPLNYASVACFNMTESQDYNVSFAGSSDFNGAVALTYLGIKGRICNDSWDDQDARVACVEMGFQNGMAYSHYRASYSYKDVGGPYWSSNFQCSGSETKLQNCAHTAFGSVTHCNSGHYAGALCYNDEGVAYKMTGGGDNYGRVEVRVSGQWGTMCGTSWNNANSAVFCRSLGFADGIKRTTSDLDRMTGIVWNPDPRCRGNETDLHHCLHEAWKEATSYYCTSHSDDAGVFCYTNVRLSSGPGKSVNHGAVNVYYNSSWHRVCSQDFDDTTARMMCQELGYVDGRAICCSAYGGVRLNYALNLNISVTCHGTESSFKKCIKEQTCDSDLYASAVCTDDAAQFSDASYTIGLKDPGASYGPLMVKQYGIEGRICSANWTDEDAAVFCRYSGYTSGFAYYHSHAQSLPTEVSVGPYWLSNFNCNGTEKTLQECPHSDRLSLGNCTTQNTAGVACYDELGIQYRLAGGSSETTGRVEMAIDGKWGTVCDLTFDRRDADVFCRSLNFSSGELVERGKFGRGSGPIWLHDIHCVGSESVLHACPHSGFIDSEQGQNGWWFFTRPCSTHDDDAVVACYGSVKLNRPGEEAGAVMVNRTGGYFGVCDDSFSDLEGTVACRSLKQGYEYGLVIKGSAFGNLSSPTNITSIRCSGSETDILNCDIRNTGSCNSGHYASVQCSRTPITDTSFAVRLNQDPYSHSFNGIVEVRVGGVWGRVCYQGWDDADASVTCKQLGFKGGVAYLHIYRNNRPILHRNMRCTGSETSLEQCPHDTTPDLKNCPYLGNDAGAICYNSSGIQYRLNPGNGTSSASNFGRVEVGYDGQWSSICSWRWTSTEAEVFCKYLGHEDGIPEYPETPLPLIPHVLSGTFCEGNETTIFQCLNTGFNTTYLASLCRDEAYTTCYASPVAITDMRLVLENGTLSRSTGRVEVFVTGPNAWGTVCNDYWDDVDASVVCRALGHGFGIAETNLLHGSGTGSIWLDNMHCAGNETSLANCLHRGIGTHNCQHSEDAGVICMNASVTTPTTTTTTTAGPVRPEETSTTTATTTTRPTTNPVQTTAMTPTTTTARSTTLVSSTIKPQVTTASEQTPITTGGTRRPLDTSSTPHPDTTTKPRNPPQEDGATAAHSSDKTAVAIIVPVIIVLLIIAAILGVVIYKFRSRKSIPHQRFTDDVINHSADGSIAMHNQLFDLNPVEQSNDPFTKYMAGDQEITLGSDGNARYSNQNGQGTGTGIDSGFNNPLYNVMKETTSDTARLDLNEANGHATSNGSHI